MIYSIYNKKTMVKCTYRPRLVTRVSFLHIYKRYLKQYIIVEYNE